MGNMSSDTIDQHKFDTYINEITNEFINTTNRLLSVYENFKNEATLNDNLSRILLYVYQIVMQDISPGCQYLASKK